MRKFKGSVLLGLERQDVENAIESWLHESWSLSLKGNKITISELTLHPDAKYIVKVKFTEERKK